MASEKFCDVVFLSGKFLFSCYPRINAIAVTAIAECSGGKCEQVIAFCLPEVTTILLSSR